MTGSEALELDAQLAQSIRERLRLSGTHIASLSSLEAPVPEWRRTARAAARDLGRPVRTLVHGDVVQAYLTDGPATADERVVHDRALRAAVTAAT